MWAVSSEKSVCSMPAAAHWRLKGACPEAGTVEGRGERREGRRELADDALPEIVEEADDIDGRVAEARDAEVHETGETSGHEVDEQMVGHEVAVDQRRGDIQI